MGRASRSRLVRMAVAPERCAVCIVALWLEATRCLSDPGIPLFRGGECQQILSPSYFQTHRLTQCSSGCCGRRNRKQQASTFAVGNQSGIRSLMWASCDNWEGYSFVLILSAARPAPLRYKPQSVCENGNPLRPASSPRQTSRDVQQQRGP